MLRPLIISQSVCPCQVFPTQSIVCELFCNLAECSTFQVLHSGVLALPTNIRLTFVTYGRKKFYKIGRRFRDNIVKLFNALSRQHSSSLNLAYNFYPCVIFGAYEVPELPPPPRCGGGDPIYRADQTWGKKKFERVKHTRLIL